MNSHYSPKVYSHRGASLEAPENTHEAFSIALKSSDGFECDIQMSKDYIPVLWHDDNLEKLNFPQKAIRDFAWPQLKQMDARKLCHGFNKATRLLALEDLLMSFSHRTSLLLEIKKEPGAPKDHQQQKVCEIIQLLNCLTLPEHKQNYLLSSFESDIILQAHALYPEGNFIINHREILSTKTIEQYYEKMPFLKGICIKIDNYGPIFKEQADEFNWLVCAYTCNNTSDILKALELKVDIIISDKPNTVKEVINALN